MKYKGLTDSMLPKNQKANEQYPGFMGNIPGYNPQKPKSVGISAPAQTAAPAQQPFKLFPLPQKANLSQAEFAKYYFEASKPIYERQAKERAELESIKRQKQQYEAGVQKKYRTEALLRDINAARSSGDYETAARLSDQFRYIQSPRRESERMEAGRLAKLEQFQSRAAAKGISPETAEKLFNTRFS